MDYRLVIVVLFTAIIHLINTLGYSVRLAGVRARSLAIAFSMWNVIFLVASTANTIQAPFLGKIIDSSVKKITPANKDMIISQLNGDIRMVMVFATLGSIVGVLLIPSFVHLFTKGIERFNQVGSVPRIILSIFLPRNAWRILKSFRLPTRKNFLNNMKRIVPYRIMIFNILIWGLFTTGILSSVFAGAIIPNYRMTTSNLSSIVNGIATVLLFIMVDPYVSSITDQALREERTEEEVKSVTFYMAITRTIGTVVAQILFIPATTVIVYVAKLI